jgi:uncharacterized membrane protein YphA (DoxX/SURF4 family)
MRWWPWAGVAGRVALGAVWVVSGALKIPDPAESVRAVRAYRLLPEAVVPLVGYGLPFFELTLGLLLIAGLAVRAASVVSALLLVMFIVGISAAWARGLSIDCGCFSKGGEVAAGQTRYPQEIARDVGLIIVSAGLARWPSTRLSLASVLGLNG